MSTIESNLINIRNNKKLIKDALNTKGIPVNEQLSTYGTAIACLNNDPHAYDCLFTIDYFQHMYIKFPSVENINNIFNTGTVCGLGCLKLNPGEASKIKITSPDLKKLTFHKYDHMVWGSNEIDFNTLGIEGKTLELSNLFKGSIEIPISIKFPAIKVKGNFSLFDDAYTGRNSIDSFDISKLDLSEVTELTKFKSLAKVLEFPDTFNPEVPVKILGGLYDNVTEEVILPPSLTIDGGINCDITKYSNLTNLICKSKFVEGSRVGSSGNSYGYIQFSPFTDNPEKTKTVNIDLRETITPPIGLDLISFNFKNTSIDLSRINILVPEGGIKTQNLRIANYPIRVEDANYFNADFFNKFKITKISYHSDFRFTFYNIIESPLEYVVDLSSLNYVSNFYENLSSQFFNVSGQNSPNVSFKIILPDVATPNLNATNWFTINLDNEINIVWPNNFISDLNKKEASFANIKKLTIESIQDFCDKVCDRPNNPIKVSFSSTTKQRFTQEQITSLQGKGWTIK